MPSLLTHSVVECEDPLDVLLGELGRALRWGGRQQRTTVSTGTGGGGTYYFIILGL